MGTRLSSPPVSVAHAHVPCFSNDNGLLSSPFAPYIFFLLLLLIIIALLDQMFVTCLRESRKHVDAFLKSMDVLDRWLSDEGATDSKSIVFKLIEQLQQSTRQLQHICNHSKGINDVAMGREVPAVRKVRTSPCTHCQALSRGSLHLPSPTTHTALPHLSANLHHLLSRHLIISRPVISSPHP